MTVYDYIGDSKPKLASQICEEFGYRINDPSSMGANLKTLVQNEGESAVRRIMEVHPDREIILEMNEGSIEKNANGGESKTQSQNSSCSCGGKKDANSSNFSNFSGVQPLNQNNSSNDESRALATNTNTIIFASALFLSIALIYKK